MIPRAVLMRSGRTRTISTTPVKRSFQNKAAPIAKVQAVPTASAKANVTAGAKMISRVKPKRLTNTVVGNHFLLGTQAITDLDLPCAST